MKAAFTVTDEDYRPWGDQIPGAIGQKGTAETNAGRRFTAWRAYEKVTERHKYWCHGHALGTYRTFGWTPFSGADMATIIADEFTRVTKKPDVGDIIVFRDDNDRILHSVLVTSATHHWGARTTILVSSKNGSNRVLTDLSLGRVLAVYNDCYWFKTQQTCCGLSEDRVDKQYYRRNL